MEPGLATRFIYDIIHVSMPFSQIIPPSTSPSLNTLKQLMVLNCGAGEDSRKSLGLQGVQTNQS